MNKFVKVILVSIFTLFLFGCVTGSGRSRGNLSDAMDAAEDDENPYMPDDGGYGDSEIWVPNLWDIFIDNEEDQYEEWYPEENEPYDEVQDVDSPEDMFILFRGGTSLLSSPYFSKIYSGELLIGGESDNLGVYIYGGFEILDVDKSHNISESIDLTALSLLVGVEFRYYPFKDLKIFSPYLIGRGGGNITIWDYKNTIYYGTDAIYGDSVGGVTGDAGIGIDIIRLERFRLGITSIARGVLYSYETTEGFTNDVFSSNGDIKINLEAGFKF